MAMVQSLEDVPLNGFHKLLTLRSGGGSFVDGYVLSIIGVAMVQASAALGMTTFWEGIVAASALIGLLLLLIRIGTPESPRWLLSKDRRSEADAVIRRVFGQGYSTANLPEQPKQENISFWALLQSGYGTRLAFVVIFWTCAVIPVFAVYAFAPKVLLALNLHDDWAAYGSIAITLLFVVGCVIATMLINVMGRRPLMIHSFLWSGLALLLLGYYAEGAPLLILVLFGAYALFIGGAQVLELVYPNELFPTEIRANAVGIGTSLSRIGAAVGTYLVPVSLDAWGIANTMYAAAAVTLIGLVTAWFLAPETRSLNLDDAAALTPRAA